MQWLTIVYLGRNVLSRNAQSEQCHNRFLLFAVVRCANHANSMFGCVDGRWPSFQSRIRLAVFSLQVRFIIAMWTEPRRNSLASKLLVVGSIRRQPSNTGASVRECRITDQASSRRDKKGYTRNGCGSRRFRSISGLLAHLSLLM